MRKYLWPWLIIALTVSCTDQRKSETIINNYDSCELQGDTAILLPYQAVIFSIE